MRPPLVPDADEARELAETELAKATYDNSPTFWEAIVDWLWKTFLRILENLGLEGNSAVIPIALGVVAVVILLLLLRIRRTRSVKSPATAGAIFAADDVRSPAQLRLAANRAAQQQDWSTATVETFRALIRDMVNRTVLLENDGLTAQEACRIIGSAFPQFSEQLQAGAATFDDVFYGGNQADQAIYQRMAQLDDSLVQAQPLLTMGHEAAAL